MNIPKFVQKDLELQLADDGQFSFEEFVHDRIKRDVSQAVTNVHRSHPNWPKKFLEPYVLFGRISDPPNGWYLRGVARRAKTDDLDEFGLFLQMHVRSELVGYGPSCDDETAVWTLLKTLAIGDEEAVERFLKIATFPLSSGHPDSRTIYNGTIAVLRSDKTGLAALKSAKTSGDKTGCFAGIVETLQGIASRDPKRVTSGLEKHLEGFRKPFRINSLEKLISIDAHGLFRLAEQTDPKLVANFDWQRDFPWDQEFHVWSNDWRPTLSVEHFGGCPKLVAEAFVNLKTSPDWTHPYSAWGDDDQG